jgi:hypothetical protein
MSKSYWYWIWHSCLVVLVVCSRFDAAVISVAIIALIFLNLGDSNRGPFSAYSVFNKGFAYLLGDARPQFVDQQLRNGGQAIREPEFSDADEPTRGLDIPSRFMNKPCICGSGLKAKKCCSSRAGNRRDRSKPSPEPATAHDPEYDFTGFEVVG